MFSERSHLICEQSGWKTEKNGKKIGLRITTPRKDTFFFEVSTDSFISDVRAFVKNFRKVDYLHKRFTLLRGYIPPAICLVNANRFVRDAYWLEKSLNSLSERLSKGSH